MVTREPEWNAATRNRALGHALYERQLCDGCGLHESVRNDPDADFEFVEEHCPICAAQARYARVLAHRDDRDSMRDERGRQLQRRPGEPRDADGRQVYIRRLSPDEAAERRDAHGAG